MTDLERMAIEAGFWVCDASGDIRASRTDAIVTPWLEHLEAAIRADEREKCAVKCDAETKIQHGEFGAGWVAGAKSCAAAIRAGSE